MIKNLFNCSLRPGGLSNVGRAYLEISSTEIVVQKIVKIVKFIILMPYLLINDLFCIGKRGESGILTRGQLFTSNHQIKILKIGLSCLGALYSCPYIRKKLYANGSQQIPFYKNNAFLISGGALVLSVIAASLIYYKKKLLDSILKEANWAASMEGIYSLRAFKIDYTAESTTEKDLKKAIVKAEKIDGLLSAVKLDEFSPKEVVKFDQKLRSDVRDLKDSFTNALSAIHLTRPRGESLEEGFEKDNWNETLKIIARLEAFKNSFRFESPDSEKKLCDAISEVERAERLLNEIKLPELCNQELVKFECKLRDDIRNLKEYLTLALESIITEKEYYEEYVAGQKEELAKSLRSCIDLDSYFKFLQKARKVIINIVIGVSIRRLPNLDQDIYGSYSSALVSVFNIFDQKLQMSKAPLGKLGEVKNYIKFLAEFFNYSKNNFSLDGSSAHYLEELEKEHKIIYERIKAFVINQNLAALEALNKKQYDLAVELFP